MELCKYLKAEMSFLSTADRKKNVSTIAKIKREKKKITKQNKTVHVFNKFL